MRTTRWRVLGVALVLVAAGCGGDDGDAGGDGAGVDGGDGPGEPPSADAVAADCPAQGFSGEISRVADAGHVDAAIATADVIAEDVIAARLSAGGFYTIYVSDHEYVGDPRDFETVEAAPGGVVATLSLGLQTGYFKDTPFSHGDEGATVAVIVDSGGGAAAASMNATGTITPRGWSEDWVCLDIEYTDDFQSVSGSVSAPVVAGF